MMSDIAHQWGGDLSIDATGDLMIAEGPALGQQRILRRLLTSPLDYLWHPNYGAGLGGAVGQPANAVQTCAVIRGQIFNEASVAKSPEPLIDVTTDPGNSIGEVYVHILYVDATTNTTQTAEFAVGA